MWLSCAWPCSDLFWQNMMGDADLRVKCGAVCALPRVALALIGFDKHAKVDDAFEADGAFEVSGKTPTSRRCSRSRVIKHTQRTILTSMCA